MTKFLQGTFRPQNPKKYKGDSTNIIYRSSWELKFMIYLDNNSDIVEWKSEEFFIPYLNKLDNRYHRYFPDFWVKTKNNEIFIIEIKPKSQAQPPVNKKNKKQKTLIKEVETYVTNDCKWAAAKEYCADRKWKFLVLTEDELLTK